MKASAVRVELYSSPGCGYCRQAKTYLHRLGIPFREYDVARNRDARQRFIRAGGRGVPFITVGDRYLQGFSPAALQQVLRRSGFHV